MMVVWSLARPIGNATAPRALAGALVALLLLSLAPAVPAASATMPPLGMSMDAIGALKADGAAPAFGSYWVGPWMATSGWGGLDNALKAAVANDVTPVVYWYYWGDSITPSCVDNGCNGRSQAQWTSMTATLADHLRTHLAGREVLVVLENEFNKGGITGTYASTFDGKLEAVALKLKEVPGVKIVVGFGAWGENEWTKFPRTVAQSEYVGYQMMRGSTRDTEASYRGAADRVSYLATFVAQKFNKPSFLYDLALSSYPDANWERIQAETLQAVFDALVPAGQNGLRGVVYRSLKDTYMDPSNYFGAAESHWGLKKSDGTAKPAYAVWRSMATGAPAQPPAPPQPNAPGTSEAEAMTATAGGRHADASASSGAAWNLWSNGELRKTLIPQAAGEYRVRVAAMGQPAAGVDPRMELRLDAKTLAAFSVPAGAYREFTVDLTLPEAGGLFSVAYTNDAIVNGTDRNLIVDVVRVDPKPDLPPTAAFTSAVQDLTATFDASGSRDPEGKALTYAWSFGDGMTGAGVSVAHAYASAGDYTVTLSVSDGKSTGTATGSVRATRANAAPTAAFTMAGDALTVRFDASASSDPDGDALTYAWTFGDGATATGATATHAYARPGAYNATLTVSDGTHAPTLTQAAQATYPAPVASFQASGSGSVWSFDASASRDPAGGALTYAWDLGDGTKASGPTATRTYAAAGAYDVTLTVTNRFGESATQKMAVRAEGYTATFSTSGGNKWWVQVAVASNERTVAVCASVDGGACQALTLQSWGEWAASFRVPDGSKVVFTATSETGKTATSESYAWPTGKPYMTATFRASGNNWWVQAMVDSASPLQGVCASVNGGKCQALRLQSWGGWAASFYVPNGAQVRFTATSTIGEKVTSQSYVWPVK